VSCPVKKQKPPQDLKRPWNAIALRASLVEVRLRDLRHTARPCENVRLWHLRPPRFVECQLRARSCHSDFAEQFEAVPQLPGGIALANYLMITA
jgi:hypothetical protein